MELSLILMLVILGLLVSFLCSMVGLGGGVLFLPILILLFKIKPKVAVGTSIFAMTMVTLSATIGYMRQGNVDWKLGLAYDIFDIPGIILGAFLTTIIAPSILTISCGISVSVIGIIVLLRKNKEVELTKTDKKVLKKGTIDVSYAWKGSNVVWVIVSSFLGGLITGMVGLGGGTVDTTTMILLGVPINIAAGSSSFAMLLTNIVGLSTHVFLGNINWNYALPLGIAALIGAQIGSQVATKANKSYLKKGLGAIVLFTGLRLLFSLFMF